MTTPGTDPLLPWKRGGEECSLSPYAFIKNERKIIEPQKTERDNEAGKKEESVEWRRVKRGKSVKISKQARGKRKREKE